MLVLTRKSGEELLVPKHGIAIKVLEIRGNKVRLGITAPADTTVYRHEVWARLQAFHEEGKTPLVEEVSPA
jgi:carbon storage regulator